ncbi:MAG: preprotein translocase subunit SecY [Patescibacteria group bacterium]
MNAFLAVFKDKDIRAKIIWSLGFLALFRLFAAIPIPAVDPSTLGRFLGDNIFGLLNIFSGGALENVSIVMLGVGPFITASIIMQLLTMIFPSLKEIYQESGEAGRRKFNQYSRWLTVPLAFMQGYGILALLTQQGIIPQLGGFELFQTLVITAAGSVFLMWMGELISEYGIGNGVSLIIFAGIISGIPRSAIQLWQQLRPGAGFDPAVLQSTLAFLVIAPIVIAGVVIITEAERPIPISYARRVRGMKMYGGVSTYLPLRVNQAGVIPIIFAISILLMPTMIGSFMANSANATIARIGSALAGFINHQWLYGSLYFSFVFLFTYFYTAVTFDPEAISSNLQKQGGFIPGIRPGPSTSEYLSKLITRITFFGAFFLGAIAILPLIIQNIVGGGTLSIGGTALLIVVSVIIETVKQIRAQMTLREYD